MKLSLNMVVSKVFEDPMDINIPSLDVDLKSLESDHEEADTHIVFSIGNSAVEHIVVVSQDTTSYIYYIRHWQFHCMEHLQGLP